MESKEDNNYFPELSAKEIIASLKFLYSSWQMLMAQ